MPVKSTGTTASPARPDPKTSSKRIHKASGQNAVARQKNRKPASSLLRNDHILCLCFSLGMIYKFTMNCTRPELSKAAPTMRRLYRMVVSTDYTRPSRKSILRVISNEEQKAVLSGNHIFRSWRNKKHRTVLSAKGKTCSETSSLLIQTSQPHLRTLFFTELTEHKGASRWNR